jgi:arginine decarboxylase
MSNKLIIGNKIPHKYFYTKGSGESNYGGKGLPYEAGSYDAALTKAKIEQCNMMFYTSLLPPTSKEITRAQGLKTIKWGNVMDSIMAIMNLWGHLHVNTLDMVVKIMH